MSVLHNMYCGSQAKSPLEVTFLAEFFLLFLLLPTLPESSVIENPGATFSFARYSTPYKCSYKHLPHSCTFNGLHSTREMMYCATLGTHKNRYSIHVWTLCVLENGGVLEYYTGTHAYLIPAISRVCSGSIAGPAKDGQGPFRM